MQVNDHTAFQGLAASTHSIVHNAMNTFYGTVSSFQSTVRNMEGLFTRSMGRRLFDTVPVPVAGEDSSVLRRVACRVTRAVL
jgi:hypothetical protein